MIYFELCYYFFRLFKLMFYFGLFYYLFRLFKMLIVYDFLISNVLECLSINFFRRFIPLSLSFYFSSYSS